MEQWRKNLYALWAMQMMAFLGTSLVFPFLPLYVQDLGVVGEKAVARWSGLIFSATFLASALFTPIWGSIGDRHGRKMMVLRANFGLCIVIGSMGLVGHAYQLLALRLLQGCLGGFVPPCLALISTCAPKDRMGYALGFMQTAQMGGAIIGPLLGGIMADLLGFRHVFFVTAGLIFIGGVVVSIFVTDPGVDTLSGYKSRVIPNIRFVARQRALSGIALSMLSVSFSMSVLQPVFPLFVESLGAPKAALATTVGALFAIAGFTNIFSAPFWGRRTDTRGAKATLSTSLMGAAVFYFAQAFAQTIYHLAPFRLMLGLFTGGVSPSSQSIVVENSPDSRRGGVMGVTTSISMIGNFLGPITGGFLAAVLGIRLLFVFTAVMLILVSFAVRVLVQDTRPGGQVKAELEAEVPQPAALGGAD